MHEIEIKAQEYMKPDERLDDLQCRGYYIIQNPKEFCFGMDAVLLADFATGCPGGKVIDLGTGTGVIPMLMEARGKGAHFVGLEIQEDSADRASRSVKLNGLEDKIEIVCGSVETVCDTAMGAANSFDCVVSNPPYIKGGGGLLNAHTPKNIARHEGSAGLEGFVATAAKLLKPGGSFAMVHKPFRLAEIIRVLSAHNLEPKRMCLVQPYADKAPNMVLLESVKGGGVQLNCEPALVVYNPDGTYTDDLLHRYGDLYQ